MEQTNYFRLTKLRAAKGVLESIFLQSILELPWTQDHYSDGAIGKPSCYFGPLPIAYDIIVHEAKPIPKFLHRLKDMVERETGSTWEAVYVNFYRDGNDVIRKHADRGNGSTAAVSLSLGATRTFWYEDEHQRDHAVTLSHGTLMQGNFLDLVHWIAPEPEVLMPRLNFTFRRMEAYEEGSYVAKADQFEFHSHEKAV